MVACLVTSSPATFLLGKTLRAEMTFEDPNPDDPEDPYVDPDTVTVRIKHPEGTPPDDVFVYDTDLEVVREDRGRYYILIPTDQAGLSAVRWEGVGTWPAADEITFKVRAGVFTP